MANKSVVDEMEQEVTNGSHDGLPCNGQAQDQGFTAKEIQAPTAPKSSVSREKKEVIWLQIHAPEKNKQEASNYCIQGIAKSSLSFVGQFLASPPLFI